MKTRTAGFCCIAILVLGFLNPLPVEARLFLTRLDYAGGSDPYLVFTCDLDSDGHQGQTRRFHYIVDVTLAGGQHHTSWRQVWQNVQAGAVYTRQWSQTIPALPTLEGLNRFELTATDVTPPPYNLPPYPPAGDTDVDNCTITGVAP